MAPARTRNARRDQSSIGRPRVPGAAAVPAVARGLVARPAFRRYDITCTPTTAPTRATIIAVVAVAAGEPSDAKKPASANTPKPAAAAGNDQRTATIPRSAPMAAAVARIRVSSGQLVVRPEQPDDEVLGAGRLVVDDELADRGEERGAAEESRDELGQADPGERGDGAGDGRPEAAVDAPAAWARRSAAPRA